MITTLLLIPLLAQAPQKGLVGGAEAVRRLVAHRPGSATPADPFLSVREASAVFRASMSRMTPAAAAEGWLALLHKWEQAAPPASEDGGPPDQFAEIMMVALPAPETWPIIRAGIAKLPVTDRRRAEAAVFDDLLGRDAAVLEYLKNKPRTHPEFPVEFEENMALGRGKMTVEALIAQRAGDLDLLAKVYPTLVGSFGFNNGSFRTDWVRIFGKARAAVMIRKALVPATSSLPPLGGSETLDLERFIILTDLANLKYPQWGPAQTLEDYPFVAAQVERFGEDKFSNGSIGPAQTIYVLGLAQRGQIDHALKLLNAPSFQGAGADRSIVITDDERASLFSLVSKLLDRTNADALWSLYQDLGRSLGRLAEVALRLDSALAAKDLAPTERDLLLGRKADLDVAFGKADDGIKELEAILSEGKGWGAESAARTLLEVSEATGSPKLVAEVARAAANMGTARGRLDFPSAYLSLGLVAEAQRAVLAAAQDVHNVNLEAEGQGRLLNAAPKTALDLAGMYYRADQPDQVLTLLREYPSWGTNDLAPLVDFRYRTRLDDQPLGFYAAWALSKRGERLLAVRVLHALIASDRESDAAFELLNELDGAAALPFYDRLIAAYPSEPRLLVWKADLLARRATNAPPSPALQEAEHTVRNAIALDPTGPFQRWSSSDAAYRILARILRAEGRFAEAAPCDRMILAAQSAATGDRYRRAGMETQAVEEYRKALSIYPDAGPVYIALGDTLRELGRIDEANAAFVEAIRRVPSCEGPIGGLEPFRYRTKGLYEPSVAAAIDAVYRAHPHDPGVLTFVGGYRESLDDHAAALAAYEEAVNADPNYRRAWEGIRDLAAKGDTSLAQGRAAFLALIRLDPIGWPRYDEGSAAGVFSDKSPLWRAYARAAGLLVPRNTAPLFSLAGSRRSLTSGAHPYVDLYLKPALYQGPGAALAALPELQALYP